MAARAPGRGGGDPRRGAYGEAARRALPHAVQVSIPKYRASLVDPHRDDLRKRRAEEPAVPVAQLVRPDLTALAGQVGGFATLLVPDYGPG